MSRKMLQGGTAAEGRNAAGGSVLGLENDMVDGSSEHEGRG